jgi:hypothetical protein
MLKQHLQIENQIIGNKTKGIIQTTQKILHKKGIKGFFTGYTVTILRGILKT